MKVLVLAVLMSVSAFAETVYFSAKGKTFHKKECYHLKRSKEVLHSEQVEAEKHGLKKCMQFDGSSKKASSNGAWASK